MFQCSGSRVEGSGFRIQGLGLRVEGSGSRVLEATSPIMMQLALVLPETISGWMLASATRSPVVCVCGVCVCERE